MPPAVTGFPHHAQADWPNVSEDAGRWAEPPAGNQCGATHVAYVSETAVHHNTLPNRACAAG